MKEENQISIPHLTLQISLLTVSLNVLISELPSILREVFHEVGWYDSDAINDS